MITIQAFKNKDETFFGYLVIINLLVYNKQVLFRPTQKHVSDSLFFKCQVSCQTCQSELTLIDSNFAAGK